MAKRRSMGRRFVGFMGVYMKKKSIFILKIGFILVLFTLIFKPEWLGCRRTLFGNINVMDVLRELQRASSGGWLGFVFCLACATGVKLLGIFSGIMRWKLLLWGQGLHMPFARMTYQWFMGRAIGLLLPGTLGLDGYRLVASARDTREVVKCTTVIAIEKLTGIIALSFLVFLTFPLGFKYLHINIVLFALIMLVLFVCVATSLLLLLNPRVIQVLVAVTPAPKRLRSTVDKLGTAVTAYSGSRSTLILALFFGLMVHVAMCLMYFFTFLALRAENTSIADIFFVSPLLITASVLAFTISGLGVREVVFGLVLGGTTGHAAAVLGGHLGLWSGELIPFVLSAPLLLFGGRLSKTELQREVQALRAEAQTQAPGTAGLHLTPEEVHGYRRKIMACLGAGCFAGLLAGAFIGLAESFWLVRTLVGLSEFGLFAWGPAVYGLLFAGLGVGIAAGLLFLYLLFNRFASWMASYALCFSGVLGIGGLVIGLFRYKRDVVSGHAMGNSPLIILVLLVLGVALTALVAAYFVARMQQRVSKGRAPALCGLGLAGYLMVIGAGGLCSIAFSGQGQRAIAPAATTTAVSRPNIVLITVDALRADYLKLYERDAVAQTPVLDRFAKDGVLFQESYAQASWTKPAFATLFTGLYPEAHKATTKTAMLPEEIDTLAERLAAGGYYTKGFSNNPNVTRIFQFDQGFVDYTDLKPAPVFGAPLSATKLSLYEVLRKGKQRLSAKLAFLPGIGAMQVTDFYQPAKTVTEEAVQWLDSTGMTLEQPFYLYLHYMDTHDPFMDHARPGVGYARARMENPPASMAEEMRVAYVSEIEYFDQYLGVLLEELKQRNRYEDTLIVVVADHGEEFQDHGGWWHGQTLFDEVIGVPMLLKLPGNAHAGTVNTDLARQIDLPPTILHLAGLEPGEHMSGRPLYLKTGGFDNAAIQYSYAENDFEGNVLRAVRNKTWKYIEALGTGKRNHPPKALYDLTADPQEWKNVAEIEAYIEEERELRKAVETYQKVIAEHAAEPTAEADLGAVQEQLESLGYLE